MDNILSQTITLISEHLWVALLLYWLALVQPARVLQVISFVLACCIISTFFGYPELYMRWVHGLLSYTRFMPDVVDYDLQPQHLQALDKAYARGFYLAATTILSGFMLYLPIRRMGSVQA